MIYISETYLGLEENKDFRVDINVKKRINKNLLLYLKTKGINLKSKWGINLGVVFDEENIIKTPTIIPGITYTDSTHMVYVYTIVFPLSFFIKNENVHYQYAKRLWNIISDFISNKYKKINKEEMLNYLSEEELKELKKLPFPTINYLSREQEINEEYMFVKKREINLDDY